MIDARLVKRGWTRISLHCEAFEVLRSELSNAAGCGLAEYHTVVPEDRHDEVKRRLAAIIWTGDAVRQMLGAQRRLLTKEIVQGSPLAYQAAPYLRIARPSRADDNIGFHRDSDYGQSVDEITIHLALTATDEASGLRFLPRSHRMTGQPIPINEVAPPGRDDLGMPSQLIVYSPSMEKSMSVMRLAVGEAVAFNPRCIHGQVVNRGDKTRVAMDFRIVRADRAVAQRDGGAWYKVLS